MKSLTIEQLMQTRSALKIVMGLMHGLGSDTDELKAMLNRINGALIKRGAKGIKETDVMLPTEDVGMPVPIMDWKCMSCSQCVESFNRKYGTVKRVEVPTGQ